MGTPALPYQDCLDFNTITPVECCAYLTQNIKPIVNCANVSTPSDMLSLCRGLAPPPIPTDVYAYAHSQNSLTGEILKWSEEENDQGYCDREMDVMVTRRNHPGQSLISLHNLKLTRCSKDIKWCLSHLSELMSSVPVEKIDLELLKPSYFTEKIKPVEDIHFEATEAEIHEDKKGPLLIRAAMQDLPEPEMEKTRIRVCLPTLILKPLPGKSSAFFETATPQPEQIAKLIPSLVNEITTQAAISTTSSGNGSSSHVKQRADWYYRDESVIENWTIDEKTLVNSINISALSEKRYNDAVGRLPWSLFSETKNIFKSATCQNLVKEANTLSLGILGQSLPSLGFDDEEGVARAAIQSKHKLMAEEWMLSRANDLTRQAREAKDIAQPHRLAQWSKTFKGKEVDIKMPFPQKVENLYLTPFWSETYTKKTWQVIYTTPWNNPPKQIMDIIEVIDNDDTQVPPFNKVRSDDVQMTSGEAEVFGNTVNLSPNESHHESTSSYTIRADGQEIGGTVKLQQQSSFTPPQSSSPILAASSTVRDDSPPASSQILMQTAPTSLNNDLDQDCLELSSGQQSIPVQKEHGKRASSGSISPSPSKRSKVITISDDSESDTDEDGFEQLHDPNYNTSEQPSP